MNTGKPVRKPRSAALVQSRKARPAIRGGRAAKQLLEGDADRSGTAVQKALRILQALVSGKGTQLADLSAAVDLPKPTVHRLITQLLSVNLVQRELDGRSFTVGPALVGLSVNTLGIVAGRPGVRDVMRELVDAVKESCNLAILRDHEIEYLERVECNFPLRMQLQAGSRVPLHCTASGKLFLSRMPNAKRQKLLRAMRLERYTPNTLTNSDDLEAECMRIRETGVSINREEFHIGLIGVSVPVCRPDGHALAALAIHAPVFRMSVDAARQHVPFLKKMAARIAAEFVTDRDE